MVNDLSQVKLDEKRTITAIAGVLLLLSVFFPWFSVSGFGMKASVSPSDFSEGLVWTGALAGIAAFGVNSLRIDEFLESLVHFAAGAMAIVSFFVIMASRSSGMNFSGTNIGGRNIDASQVIEAISKVADIGFYAYFIAAGVLFGAGIIGMVKAENPVENSPPVKGKENDQESTKQKFVDPQTGPRR